MKKSKFWFVVALLILLVAIVGTLPLVKDEFVNGNICPRILGIPACYIVLFCFANGLMTHLFGSNHRIYFLLIGLVTIIASYGTIGELFGFAKCPRTSNNIPMCFISFAICITALLSKYMQINAVDS